MEIFKSLFSVIENRKGAAPEESYTAFLLSQGIGKINDKIAEEAAEVCEAAFKGEREHIVYEICDLLYHTFVLAGCCNISLEEIADELERRFGKSGLQEKAERRKK